MTDRYPGPVARNTDPTTSHAAAERAGKNADILRARVRRVMENHGDWMTHEEIYRAYLRTATVNHWPEASESGVRTRVRELFTEGVVERDPKPTVKNANGNRVHQWRYVTDPDRREQLRHDRVAEAAEEDRAERDQNYIMGPTLAVGNYHYIRERDRDAFDILPLDTVIMTTGFYPEVMAQEHVGRWRVLSSTAPLIASPDIYLPARVLYIPEDALTPELSDRLGQLHLTPKD